ncbi:MAG: hypothetical protein IPM82_12650 [Saprospiraceae bacterium]|nr:hypothetical protein [Saprospiraceae bacterium]
MRFLICTLAILVSNLPLSAQSEAIKNLEGTTTKLSGEDYLNNALTLADWLYNEGFFEKSVEWADKAANAAKKLKQPNYLAISLNQRGKAQMKVPSRRDNLKNKAFKSFEESNSLTTDAELKLDNLVNMKELATQLNKKKDLERIEREIAVLSGGDASVSTPGGGGLFSKRKKHRKILKKHRHKTSNSLPK